MKLNILFIFVALNTFALLYNYHQHHLWKLFILPNGNSVPIKRSLALPLCPGRPAFRPLSL